MALVHRRLSDAFAQHTAALQALQKRKRQDVQLVNIVQDSHNRQTKTTFGQRQPGDVYKGDVALRDLNAILAAFDANGCARPPARARPRARAPTRAPPSAARRRAQRKPGVVPRLLHPSHGPRSLQGQLEDRRASHHAAQRLGDDALGDHGARSEPLGPGCGSVCSPARRSRRRGASARPSGESLRASRRASRRPCG